MAAKMICPSCGEVSAEFGDHDKGRDGKYYRVYDSVGNLEEHEGEHRLIECLQCKYICNVEYWK